MIDADAFNNAATAIHNLALEKGWYECQACNGFPLTVRGGCNACNNAGLHRNAGELIALIHSEASEALEAMRNGHDIGSAAVAVELADIIIRTLDMAAYAGIDIGRTIEEKHASNMARPRRHNKAF